MSQHIDTNKMEQRCLIGIYKKRLVEAEIVAEVAKMRNSILIHPYVQVLD